MMHRCSGSHGNMVGPCSCGLFHSQTNSFSMLFSMPNNHRPFDETTHEMYSFPSSSPPSSSSVDCTLSLGTPSTRLTSNHDHPEKPRRSSCMSNFCWDILQSKQSSHKSSRGNNNNNNNLPNSGGEGLLARRCANCDTTSTPLWRNGPKGPKSLCNACGIRFKKEERRASAAAATNGNAGGANGGMDGQHMLNGSWVHHHHHHSPAAQKIPYFSSSGYGNHEFRFIEDDDRDSDTAIPFLSWRLNVTDRPSLVHDFTR